MNDLNQDPAFVESMLSVDEYSQNFSIPNEKKTTKRLAKTINAVPAHLKDRGFPVMVDDANDNLLTDFGKATLKEKYLTEDESYQDRFANCVRYLSNDASHAQRMYGYISKLWCMPPTPILSNSGTTKGNLISCYVNEAEDSLEGIADLWNENIWIGAGGGGIGSYMGSLRAIGESIKLNGKTSGAISFTKVIDSLSLCISQGSNRRGAAAVYLDISHPEAESFLDLRRQAGGDPDRKALNIHHGMVVGDDFMIAVQNNEMWHFRSPKTGLPFGTPVRARDLATKLVITRLETGEPYILFKDNINRAIPEHHRRSGLFVKTSNLCSEITLPTGRDHKGNMRTAVCCLFQPNADKFDEWKDDEQFFLDIAYFLDNVLEDFINNASDKLVNARYSAKQERSIGVGMMGFHSFLQSRNIPLDSAMARVWNKKIFSRLKEKMDEASRIIAEERGACPDAAEHGIMERFSNKTAIAPTATVSIVCGSTSAGVDVIPANIYTHKTINGSFEVKNAYLEKLLIKKGMNTKAVWDSILDNGGSVQHLEFLDTNEKNVFKTSFEVDQRHVVDLAAERVGYITQAQSINITLPPDCHKRDLWKVHEMAWKKGVKSLYYLRSRSLQTANMDDSFLDEDDASKNKKYIPRDYDECLVCQ